MSGSEPPSRRLGSSPPALLHSEGGIQMRPPAMHADDGMVDAISDLTDVLSSQIEPVGGNLPQVEMGQPAQSFSHFRR